MVEANTGHGLMISIHLGPRMPVGQVIAHVQKAGVWAVSTRGNTLRVLAPLVITGSEIMTGINQLKQVLEQMTVLK